MVLERKKLTVQLVSHRSRFKVTFHLPYPINVYIHCIYTYVYISIHINQYFPSFLTQSPIYLQLYFIDHAINVRLHKNSKGSN